MTPSEQSAFVNAAEVLPDVWPSFLPQLSDYFKLEDLWFQPPDYKHLDESGDWHAAHTALWFESELLFSIPGIDAVSLSIAGDGGTVIPLALEAKSEEFSVRIDDVPIAFDFERTS